MQLVQPHGEQLSLVGYPEWCEHDTQLLMRDDGVQVLQCTLCNYVFQAWTEPPRIEHFDHA